MKFHCLALAATMFSTAALANSACDKPRDDFDGLYCMNKVYKKRTRS